MKLIVDLASSIDINDAITFLSSYKGYSGEQSTRPQEAEPVLEPDNDVDDLLGGDTATDDLDSLIEQEPPPPPAAPSNADIKASIQAAVDAKGKEATNAFLKTVMEKLGVKKLSDIPDEKKANFVTVLGAFSKKK